MLENIKKFAKANKAQMGGGMDLPSVMIVLVIAAVVGFVGLQVMSTVIDSAGSQKATRCITPARVFRTPSTTPGASSV